MGQAPARKVIEANEFVLRDASGQKRARLSMEATERPTLSFYKDKTCRSDISSVGWSALSVPARTSSSRTWLSVGNCWLCTRNNLAVD
jgi:hypothetical protein